MQYIFEELQDDGQLYSGELSITDYDYEPAIVGIPYNGGSNLPEPSEPARYIPTSWEYYEVFDSEGEPVLITEELESILDSLIDWEDVEDELYEYNN